MIEFIYQEPTLRQALIIMHRLQNRGYDCFFKGKGDGSVHLIIEDNKFTIGGNNDK